MPGRSPKLVPSPVLQGKIMNPQSAWLKKCWQLCQNQNPQNWHLLTKMTKTNWKPANKNQKMKSHGCDSTWRWRMHPGMIEMVRMLGIPGRVMKCGILFFLAMTLPMIKTKIKLQGPQWLEHDIKWSRGMGIYQNVVYMTLYSTRNHGCPKCWGVRMKQLFEKCFENAFLGVECMAMWNDLL